MTLLESKTEIERISPIHCLFYWAKKQPNKVYFTQPLSDGTVANYTWGEVADQVQRMAAYLHSLNLPKHSQIGILGKNSAHWIMSDLAIWLAGHVTVPLYPTLNSETAKHVLDHSEVKALFIGKLDGVTDSWFEVKEIIPSNLPCITLPMAPSFKSESWEDIQKVDRSFKELSLPNIDDLASVIYTSGSTGMPKGVMHSFRTMMQVSRKLEEQFNLGSNERLISYLPLAHALERVLIETTSLFLGCHVFFGNNLETFVSDIGRARPTMFISVPRLWTKFQHGINGKIPPHIQKILFRLPVVGGLVRKFILKKLGLNEVRLAITGSAPLPHAVLQWYQDLGLDLLEGYGMTENFAYSHINRAGANKIGYVGFPQEGVECRIAEDGEVQVKSPGTMLGYYKEPDKTAETMTDDGFLKTGDTGEMDSDNCLKLTGRIKDIFKTSKGKYIAPVPIELKLGESPYAEIVCVGGGVLPQPIGLIMLDEETQKTCKEKTKRAEIEASLEELLQKVNQDLESHEKLGFLVAITEPWTMESGLLTPTMKIRRQKIEDHYATSFEEWEKQKQAVVWS
jgi:long-subunit acyl-CoA synthetase (AMP-forming)